MPVHAKLEVDDPTIAEQVVGFLREHPAGRAAFTARTCGSGESVHAHVKLHDGMLVLKDVVHGAAKRLEIEHCAEIMAQWRTRTYSKWVTGEGLVEQPPELAFRTKRGKLGFYVKLVAPE